MCYKNLKPIEQFPIILFENFLGRMVDGTWEGIVMVDNEFHILLANPKLLKDFAPIGEEEKLFKHSNGSYFKVLFGLDQDKDKDVKRIEKIPVWKAIKEGKVKGQPFPMIAAANNIAYQIETHVTEIQNKGSVKRVVLEFWSRAGNPEGLKDLENFIKL